jgi:ubiquinone/menaquinone biosynthesis C-methylase UbiE
MGNEYLSTGFTDVDSSEDKGAYFDCLTLLDSLAYYRECKLKSYELLQLAPGMTVLEAGCGLGDDALRIAKLIMPGGKVIGLDASAAMIEKARSQKQAGELPAEFHVGDVKALPFSDNSFARCRIDRVLQHIGQPQKAIAELVRVLKPDGLLVAYDNDWETFTITSKCVEITRTIEKLWRDSFTNCRIGSHLSNYFHSSGLSDVGIYPGISVIEDFETADKVYNLQETVQKAVAGGRISAAQGRGWIEELIHRTATGNFRAELTSYTVVGKKLPVG